MISRDEILQQIDSYAPFPASASAAVGLLSQPPFDRRELKDVLLGDDAFRSDLLSFVRGDYFAQGKTVDDVDGLLDTFKDKELFSFVTVIGVVRWFESINSDRPSPLRLWEHCMAVALGGEILADALGLEAPDYLFATGFLHDIGKAVMESTLNIDSMTVIEQAEKLNITVDESERLIVGVDHMEVGARILERWNFPEEIVNVVRWHHLPESYEGQSTTLDLIHISDAIALMMGIGPQSEGLNYQTSSEIKTRLNLRIGAVEEVIGRIQDQYESVKTHFASLIGE